MHLTWKLKRGVVNLRCGRVLKLFETGAGAVKVFGLRMIHFSLQNDHIHMFVEADNNEAVAKGMRSLGCHMGKALRKIIGGRGPVFADRFHVQMLETPTQVRNALAYVLQNFSKHSKLLRHLDEFSSAPYFAGWRTLFGKSMGPLLAATSRPPPLPDHLCAARSWLARDGWMRAKGQLALT